MRVARALVGISVLALLSDPAMARLSDNAVRQRVIQDSITEYQATGHPCACPYNVTRNGSSCGGRSAYSRAGGAAPICYPKGVTVGMVRDWRAAHP